MKKSGTVLASGWIGRQIMTSEFIIIFVRKHKIDSSDIKVHIIRADEGRKRK